MRHSTLRRPAVRLAGALTAVAAATVLSLAAAGTPAAALTSPSTTAPDDTTETTEPTDGTDGGGLTPVSDVIEIDPDIAPAIVVDATGSPIAAISVLAVDPDWADYDDWDSPRTGNQYVRISVLVESRSARGLFEIRDHDFMLQDADGFVFTGDVVATAAQRAAGDDLVDRAALANGEQVQLELTFRVVTGVAPATLFYSPSYDRLVTIADLSR